MKSPISLVAATVLLMVAVSASEKTGTVEGTHPSPPPLCSVCWSTESAARCQSEAKPEPCSAGQLDATVTRMRLVGLSPANQTDGVVPASQAGEHWHYRCYTLTATGTGQPRTVSYAKGCATTAIDPCAGLAKERGICTICSASNCNALAPPEMGHGPATESAKPRNIGVTGHTSTAATAGTFNRWAMMLAVGTVIAGCRLSPVPRLSLE